MHCHKCGQDNPAEFYPYQRGECKVCTRERVRANRAARIEYYRSFDRTRGTTPKRKAAYVAKTKRLRASRRGMNASHGAVARAVRNGVMSRPARCSRCNLTGHIQGHHDDHLKPLDVRWLCPVCHAQRHKELGRLRTVDAPTGPP